MHVSQQVRPCAVCPSTMKARARQPRSQTFTHDCSGAGAPPRPLPCKRLKPVKCRHETQTQFLNRSPGRIARHLSKQRRASPVKRIEQLSSYTQRCDIKQRNCRRSKSTSPSQTATRLLKIDSSLLARQKRCKIWSNRRLAGGDRRSGGTCSTATRGRCASSAAGERTAQQLAVPLLHTT